MQFNTKSTKENANTKATKEYIFRVLCIELCVLCVNMYFFYLILNWLLVVIQLQSELLLHQFNGRFFPDHPFQFFLWRVGFCPA